MSGRKPGFDIVEQLPVLRRYARSLTRNDTDAEDLVHDALVRACEGRHTFRPGASLRNWLLGVVHNTFVTSVRRRRAEVIHLDALAQETPTHVAPDQENRVQLRQIGEAFLQLPDEQRAVLHLIVIEGMSYSTAATTLGVPVGTVMSRLSRARAALRAFERDLNGSGYAAGTSRPNLRVVGGHHASGK
jgi:RNA polymerase sigma-70 factor, ECF subfamily